MPEPAARVAASSSADRIIAAAAAVMGRYGYAATTMKQVAREAGVAQGLIFYYFESKDELLLAVVRSLCEEVERASRDAFAHATGEPPAARAWSALLAAHDRMAAAPERQRLLIDVVSLSATDARMRQELARLYSAIVATTAAMVEELNAEVPTPLPVPADAFATVIVAALDGLALYRLVQPDQDHEALYRSLGFMLLATLSSSYVAAGQPPPDVLRLLASLSADDAGGSS